MSTTKEALSTTIEIQHRSNRPPLRTKMRGNVSNEDMAARAAPLEVQINQEVTVINGDRSNLTWKRYKLIDINTRTGMCVVEGMADSKQRNFPRSMVKPKNWVDAFKDLFRSMAATEDDQKQQEPQHHYVEYHNFFNAMQLLGAEYDHEHALKIFKALDVRANGILSFSQFLNWVYGLGRIMDKGRLLTTIECMTGLRKWRNNLTFYVMATADNESEGGLKQCIWSTAAYDADNSNADTVQLLTTGVGDEEQPNVFTIPKNLDSFRSKLTEKLQSLQEQLYEPVYSPSNEDERECSMVVMGPGEIGKSALINKFVKGVFPHDYDPTIQDHARKQILVDEKPALLDILDTAGQDEFASMRYDWLKDGIDILLICFSRSDHESFLRAELLIDIAKRLLRQQKTPKIVPILLVATKQDLAEQMCQVTEDDIHDLRNRYGGEDFIGYAECSAFLDEGVSEVFQSAVTMYRKWRHESSGIKIKYPTLREVQQRQRQVSYVQQMNSTAGAGGTKCLSCLAIFCPAMAAYMEPEDKQTKLNIASVPKDKFGDELAEPSYSKQHFFVRREMSFRVFFYCILSAVLFPLVITVQTLIFVFYCPSANCCYKCFSEERDYTDAQEALMVDFLGPVVGRDPRETAKDEDSRKWFLSQSCGQKIARLLIMLFIDALFFFAWFNFITVGMQWFDPTDDDQDVDATDLSVMETLTPGQLWVAMWLVLGFYMSLDIDVVPPPPSMQALRPYVMYLNSDESIRTTAYVFLRGFSKSTFAIFRLEATWSRIVFSLIVSTIWIVIPGVVRVVYRQEGNAQFFPEGLVFPAISAMFVSFFIVFALSLGLQMQLLSGLVKYIDWMNDITSMLDEIFSGEAGLHYISLTRHNNTLAWLEMRTYLYTKGLIIFSRQEIFVFYIIFLQLVAALYVLSRLMATNQENPLGSPSFVGILFMFVILSYSLMRVLRTTRIIERLQSKQIALLAAQKFQIYYKRITYHPDENELNSNNELSEGGDEDIYDPEWAEIDPRNLPPINDPMEDDSDEDSQQMSPSADMEEKDGQKSDENAALLGIDDGAAPIDSQQTLSSLGGSPNFNPSTGMKLSTLPRPTALRIQRTLGGGGGGGRNPDKYDNESMFSAEYLVQSEKFVQAAINICEAQDIIPRVFNIKVQVAVGLSILAIVCAVLPTAAKLAFGEECAAATPAPI